LHFSSLTSFNNVLDTHKRYAPQTGQTQPSVLQPLVTTAGEVSKPNGVDPESMSKVKGFNFSDESIRKGFIRKVYAILSVNEFVIRIYVLSVPRPNIANLYTFKQV